jgi:protein phosphatase
MIKISTVRYISEIGKRQNNEDNYGFDNGNFVVCDGVGGSEKGEIASEITVRCFLEAFKKNASANVNDVLKEAENKLSEYIAEHPEAIGMATTLTFSQIKDDCIYVGWVGDSRVYQFRNGKILFITTDHSWVNEAVKAGIITEEEAVNHPKGNIITRAVQGSHKPTTADTVYINDIQKGDLFLHCSDGVLESWDDENLTALFSSENDPSTIISKIKAECEKYSRDNFTAIVYGIEEAIISNETQISNQPTDTVEAIPINKAEFVGNKPTIKGVMEVKILGLPLKYFVLIASTFMLVVWLKNNIGSINKQPIVHKVEDNIKESKTPEVKSTSTGEGKENLKPNDLPNTSDQDTVESNGSKTSKKKPSNSIELEKKKNEPDSMLKKDTDKSKKELHTKELKKSKES